MTEREGWGLRGPVRNCRLERTWYSRRCGADACDIEERGDTTTLDFRPDGSLNRHWHHNSDGSEWTMTYEHNDDGRLMTARTENASGVVDLQFYEYDAAGRLVRVIVRSKDDDRTAESYEYDVAGRKKKTLHVDVAAQRPDTQYAWGVEGTDSCYSAPGATALTTLYDEREQPADLLFYDGVGRLLSRVEFSYDRDGNLIEEAQTRAAETLPPEMFTSLNEAQLKTVRAMLGAGDEPTRRQHRYNEQGRRAETRSRIGPLGSDTKTVAYNDHGDQSEEVFESEKQDYNIDDQGRLSDAPTRQSVSRSEARFRYEYDANGNWVRKTVGSRAANDQEFILSSVERRTVGYFE